jgi:hypothetical protein
LAGKFDSVGVYHKGPLVPEKTKPLNMPDLEKGVNIGVVAFLDLGGATQAYPFHLCQPRA